MPTPNPALVRKALDYIEAHPEEWDQEHFARRSECGTAYCLAGTIVRIARPQAEFVFGPFGMAITGSVRLDPDEIPIGVDRIAADLLGLDGGEAWALWSPYNSLDDLQGLVKQMEAPDFDGTFILPNREVSNADA